MSISSEEGKAGENLAAAYLAENGYRIVTRNFRYRRGEIDIIAETESLLVFVEVKERKTGALVSPLESVTADKQARILRTASLYLLRHPTSRQPRFDVIGLTRRENGTYEISHIKNAFGGGSWH